MTIKYLAGNIAIGTSTERIAATWTGTPDGYEFRETDTGINYYRSGSTWSISEYRRRFGQTKKMGRYYPNVSGTVGEGILAGAPATFGTVASAPVTDASGQYLSFSTGATINTTTGVRFSRFTFRAMNPWFIAKIKLPSVANTRASIFFTSSAANPTTNADSLANLSGAGFFYDSGVNANWRIYTNNGGASSHNTDSTTAAGTSVTTFEVKAIDATPAFAWRINGFPDGTWTNETNTPPATGTYMCIQVWIEDLASSDSKAIQIYDVHAIQDG